MSLQTLRVLEAFLENPMEELAGTDVQKRGGLASGTLYPILLRLESAGWFVSRWEAVDPSSIGRPRRFCSVATCSRSVSSQVRVWERF